jgi:16S rRNA (cytidine1402-2'-O)-methyltransferase
MRDQAVALVSDAGTPLVSDPGYRLVREARAARDRGDQPAGPSAPVVALTLSGLPSDRFLFAGFCRPRTRRGQTRSPSWRRSARPWCSSKPRRG